MCGDSIDRDAVRRNLRRLLIAVVGLTLVGIVAGLVAGVLVGSHGGGHPHRHPAVTVLLAVAVPLLVVGLAAVAVTWLLRRPPYQRILQFGWSECRATFKAVRSGRPLTEEETGVARAQLEFRGRSAGTTGCSRSWRSSCCSTA